MPRFLVLKSFWIDDWSASLLPVTVECVLGHQVTLLHHNVPYPTSSEDLWGRESARKRQLKFNVRGAWVEFLCRHMTTCKEGRSLAVASGKCEKKNVAMSRPFASIVVRCFLAGRDARRCVLSSGHKRDAVKPTAVFRCGSAHAPQPTPCSK